MQTRILGLFLTFIPLNYNKIISFFQWSLDYKIPSSSSRGGLGRSLSHSLLTSLSGRGGDTKKSLPKE